MWARLFISTLKNDVGLDALAVLRKTTMLPYISAFWSNERRARFTASLQAPQDAPHDPSLDLWLLFGVRDGSLRWCPECVDEEEAAHEELRWHRSHQLPWVDDCPKHRCALQLGSPLGVLPLPLSSLVSKNDYSTPVVQSRHEADTFAVWSLQLLEGALGPYDPDELRPIYRDCLLRTHPEFLVPQSDMERRFVELLQQVIGTDVYARLRTRWPHAGWTRFFRWIWSEPGAVPPKSTELHLWFWAACGIDPAILPCSCLASQDRYPS